MLGLVGGPHGQIPTLGEEPYADVYRPVEAKQAALERRVDEQVARASLRHSEILGEAEVHAAALVFAGLRRDATAQIEIDAVAVPPALDLVRDAELDAPGDVEPVGRIARLAWARGDAELPRRMLLEKRKLELLVRLDPPCPGVPARGGRQVLGFAVHGKPRAVLRSLVGNRPLGAVGLEGEHVALGLHPDRLDHHEAVRQQLDALTEGIVP